MLLGNDDAFAASRVVDEHQRAPIEQHLVQRLAHLNGRHAIGVGSAATASTAAEAASSTAACIRIVGVVLRAGLLLVAALGGRSEVHRNHGLLAHQDDL